MSSSTRTARQRLRRECGRYRCCTIVLNSAAVACTDTLLVIAESYVEMHLHSRARRWSAPQRSRSPQKSGAQILVFEDFDTARLSFDETKAVRWPHIPAR